MKASCIIICIVASVAWLPVMANTSQTVNHEADVHIQEIQVFLRRYLDVERWFPRSSSEELKHKQSYVRQFLQKIADGKMTPAIAVHEARMLITAASVFLRSPLDPEAVVIFYDLLQTTDDEVIRRVCVEFIHAMRAGVSLSINNSESVADLARRYAAGEFESPDFKRLMARMLADNGSYVALDYLQSVVADTQIDPAERFACALSLYALDPEHDVAQVQVINLLVDSDVSLNDRYRFLVNLKRYGTNVSEAVVTTAMDSENDSVQYHISELLVVSGDLRGIAVARSLVRNGNSEFSVKAQELLSNRLSPSIDPTTPVNELQWDSKLRVFTRGRTIERQSDRENSHSPDAEEQDQSR